MARLPIEQIETDDYLMEVVSKALREEALSGLSNMLECISKAVDAYGCILWEVAPGAKLEGPNPEGRLYVLAEWFDDGNVFAKHDMPLTESVNGAVIISQQPENIEDVRTDPRAYTNAASRHTIDTMRLRSMCSVPILFSDKAQGTITKGTVSLYRNTSSPPFNTEEFSRVQRMARLVPELYQAIRDKASQKLTHQVNEILHNADVKAAGRTLLKDEINAICHQVCIEVTKTFQCIETSIFMEDRTEAVREYRLLATTWSLWSSKKKDTYRPLPEEGVTGWVLARGKPVRIFSLSDFERDKEIIQKEFPGLLWNDSLGIKVSARKILKLSKKAPLPPLSFMAAPILGGGKVLGVIRCCTAKEVPYYFADRELSLLNLVAVQLSRFWSNWLIRREIDVERRAWPQLIDWVSRQNNIVQQELNSPVPSTRRVFDRTLGAVSDVVAGADIRDVRLYDPTTQSLYFEAMHGLAWRKGTSEEVKARRERRFPVKEAASSHTLGVQVYHSGKAMAIFDVERKNYQSKTFPETKRIIVAPIHAQGTVIGVLTLRGTGGEEFPAHALKMTEMLGQQLGLYYYLTIAIKGLRESERAHVIAREQRLRTNEDLAHQLKSPLIQAHTRIHSIIRNEKITDNRLESKLLALRGLIAKAKRVSMSTGLLAELEREGSIQIQPERLQRLGYDKVIKTLVEAAMDNEQMIDPYRKIKFNVVREGFEVLVSRNFRADFDLVEQAVSCLLDNAGKYSFPGTRVDIVGGLTNDNYFYISVINQGIQLKKEDIEECTQRLWRSEQATWLTGEGSGIGLFVVDNIMKAHYGKLFIIPTNFKGETQFRLLFSANT